MSTIFEASYDELKRLEDENERLKAELKEALDANGWLANTVAAEALRLRAALKPFANRADNPGADKVPDDGTVTFFMKDCRDAKIALGSIASEQNEH